MYANGRTMNTQTGSSWFSLITDYAPLLLLGFSICMLKGMKGLRMSYMGKTFLARMLGLVIRSCIGAAMAVGCALLLPLLKIDVDQSTMLGVVVFISVCGVQIVDGLVYKYLGIHLVDMTDTTVTDSEWAKLDEIERIKALELYNRSIKGEKDNG